MTAGTGMVVDSGDTESMIITGKEEGARKRREVIYRPAVRGIELEEGEEGE
jgi:hypothetical protein